MTAKTAGKHLPSPLSVALSLWLSHTRSVALCGSRSLSVGGSATVRGVQRFLHGAKTNAQTQITEQCANTSKLACSRACRRTPATEGWLVRSELG